MNFSSALLVILVFLHGLVFFLFVENVTLPLQIQVRLKREHLNVAKFEPEYGLDPMLDLALVGSEWQFRIQSRASHWQDKLVVTSTRSVEQDVLSPTEVTSDTPFGCEFAAFVGGFFWCSWSLYSLSILFFWLSCTVFTCSMHFALADVTW